MRHDTRGRTRGRKRARAKVMEFRFFTVSGEH